jgi:hypothetical protein
MVRPSHVAAPDLPGQGLPESSPAFLGTWGPQFRNSTGRVRRPRSQLSDPGRMPRPPEGKREDYGLRDAKGLDTLAGGTPVCMYRQRPPGPPRERDEPAGGARSQHRAGWTACSRRERAWKSFSARAGTPRGPSPSHAVLVRRFRFLSCSSPSRGLGGSDSTFPSFPLAAAPMTGGPGPAGHGV